MEKMTFGEIIKKTREERKISQEIMAKNIKKNYNVRISTSYLSMIETNTRTNLTVKLINAFLQHLGLPREAAFSLFANAQQPVKYDSFSNVNTGVSETPNMYTAGEKSENDNRLPPEAQKPLDELYALLADKYNIKK